MSTRYGQSTPTPPVDSTLSTATALPPEVDAVAWRAQVDALRAREKAVAP